MAASSTTWSSKPDVGGDPVLGLAHRFGAVRPAAVDEPSVNHRGAASATSSSRAPDDRHRDGDDEAGAADGAPRRELGRIGSRARGAGPGSFVLLATMPVSLPRRLAEWDLAHTPRRPRGPDHPARNMGRSTHPPSAAPPLLDHHHGRSGPAIADSGLEVVRRIGRVDVVGDVERAVVGDDVRPGAGGRSRSAGRSAPRACRRRPGRPRSRAACGRCRRRCR